jgi:D-tyrosyl-tRNA(Tyr) deacylase
MRILIQRVAAASVAVGGKTTGAIGHGLLLLVGLLPDDGDDDFEWAARKVVNVRVFADDAGVMNRSVLDSGGEILAVSQFTLYASLAKGNRPSYSGAAPAAIAAPLFERFVGHLAVVLGRPIPTGIFGADMKVNLTNDGPVTLWLDTRARV